MDRKYYTCDSSQFCRGRIPTKVLESSDAVFRAMATQMADTIEENNFKGITSMQLQVKDIRPAAGK